MKWTSGSKLSSSKPALVRAFLLFPTNLTDGMEIDALSKGGNRQPGLLVESSDDEEDDGPYTPKKGR